MYDDVRQNVYKIKKLNTVFRLDYEYLVEMRVGYRKLKV